MRLAVRKDIKTQDFRAAMPEASETKVDSIGYDGCCISQILVNFLKIVPVFA
jgi:hypothetical protein